MYKRKSYTTVRKNVNEQRFWLNCVSSFQMSEIRNGHYLFHFIKTRYFLDRFATIKI